MADENTLAALGALLYGRASPGGLVPSILTGQRPSENVSYRSYPTGNDFALLNQRQELGVVPNGPNMHPMDWADSRWPMPQSAQPDLPATELPMGIQMRAVPYLNELGALLDRRTLRGRPFGAPTPRM
jgi:hypothetical protein